MTQLSFGVGALWGNRTDVTGSGIGPDQFAILQDCSIEFSWEIKELYSQYQFAVDIARGKGKITGKSKAARVFGAIYGDLFFGTTPAAGMTTVSENEAGTIGATPYQITVAQAATFVDDLGVYRVSDQARFKRVTSPSNTLEYSVNLATGVYTFASVDTTIPVSLSYVYTLTTGKKIDLTNQFMGYTPTFTATFYTIRSGAIVSGALALRLNACTASRLSIPTRLDDYTMLEFDFSAFSNAAGSCGTLSTSE